MVRAAAGLAALLGFGLAFALLVAGPLPQSMLGAAAERPATAGAPGQVSDAEVDEGRRLYLNSCASCHGTAGEGSGYAPDIRDSGAAAHDFFLRTGRMPLGRLGTPPWEQEPVLSDDQIRALVAYASTLGDGPPIPDVVADMGDVQRGWQLYINNCAACHGASGNGGGIGSDVVAPGLGRADPLIVAEAMLVGPGAMPRFAFAQDDVNAIAAYVEHLRGQPAPGGISLAGTGPVPEGFIAGLVGVGLLLLLVRWIGRRPGRTA